MGVCGIMALFNTNYSKRNIQVDTTIFPVSYLGSHIRQCLQQ